MTYVIVKPDGTQTRSAYPTEADALSAVKRQPVGSEVWWCKYARETKMLIATPPADFGTRVVQILLDHKYARSPQSHIIEGWGRKWLP